MRLPLSIPPGIVRAGTVGQSAGRWLSGNLVRSYGGDLGPVLGWRSRSDHAVSGKARAIMAYSTEGSERRIAVGTHTGLYIQTAAGVVHDITPSGFTPGNADATVNVGFGGGFYGLGTYGTPRPDTGDAEPATVWSLDNWGVYLVGCSPSDGRLLEWQNDTSADAAVITNAPTSCVGVLTTQDRFTVALGASGNPRLVMWSQRGDNTVWTPSTTNLAGSFELDTFGGIVAGVELRNATLILTDVDAHAMVYRGLPAVYAITRIGEACGAISVGCIASQGDICMWWSPSGFMRFDGSLAPVDCPIEDLMLSFNTAQRSKIAAYTNAKNTEFVWLYPSQASIENDRYISYNYVTGEWWEGELVRLSGAGQGAFAFPLLMGDDGKVYEHEVGGEYDGAVPTAQSGPLMLGDGSRMILVKGIVPDTVAVATLGFATRDYPQSAAVPVAQVDLSQGRTDVMFTARQIQLDVEFANSSGRFGKTFLEGTAVASR